MAHKQNEIGPSRVLGNSGPAWLSYALIAVFLGGLSCGLWYILAPESLARFVGRWSDAPLRIDGLVITVDQRTHEIPPDGSLTIHPGQKFSIAALKSSRWHNYDLALASSDFNPAAVSGGASASPAELAPQDTFEQPRPWRIIVNDDGREAAAFTIVSAYSALDFVTKGDIEMDPAKQAEYYQKALALDPEADQTREKLITALVESGQKDRAADLYEEDLDKNGLVYDRARALINLYAQPEDAARRITVIKRLTEMAEKQKRSPLAYQKLLASAYVQNSQLEKAAELLESLAAGADSPETSADYLGELLAIYRQQGDAEREIDVLKRLLEVLPPDMAPGIWSEIASLYAQSNDKNGQTEALQSLAKSLPPGQSKINAYKMLAKLLADEKNYSEAQNAYKEALKLAPKDIRIHLNLARLAAAKEDRKAYHAHLADVVALEPDNLGYRRELAEALLEDGLPARAKIQYQELLKHDPDNWDLRLIVIDLMEKTGDKNGLIKQYGDLLKDHPDNKIVAYNLGVLHFEKKQWSQAIEAFEKVVKLDSSDTEARGYLLACYQKKGQNKEMLDQALELYRLNPANTDYRTLLLNTYENAKNWRKFAEVAEEAARLKPEDPAGWQLLAKAQSKLGKNEEAAKSLWQAAEATKGKTAPWFTVASAFSALGKTEEARQAYQKILDLEPKNSKAAKAIMELDLKKAKVSSKNK